MKKFLSILLVLALCLTLGCAALADSDGSGLVLLNGKENKSETYGLDTYYAETLTQSILDGLTESCILVYTQDPEGITDGLSASVHGEYSITSEGVTIYLVPMDEVIVLPAGEYEQDYTGDGQNLLIVLEDGAHLTGTLTDVSLSIQAQASWDLTGDSALIGLDTCRPVLRSNVYGNGWSITYDSEVYLSDDMREWTDELTDSIGGYTSWSDPSDLSFDEYRDAILAGDKSEVVFMDNVALSIFPVNMAALITASIYDEEVDGADVEEISGVYEWTDAYADLRNGHGYAGGDIAYETVITTDPSANGQVNRSSVYVTGGTKELSDILIDEVSYATSVVYADGTNRTQDAMMKYGVDSALWAQGEDAVIDIQDFYCIGANDGFYATYGGTVIAQDGVLEVTSNHGLQVCYNGTIIARDMDIITTGMMGSAISSDHGGGFVSCDNVFAFVTYESTGGSGIYCDGYCDLWIQDPTVGSLNDNAAVMCGGGTLHLLGTTLLSFYDSSTVEPSASAEPGGSGEADDTDSEEEEAIVYGAGVYIHPMGNNPSRASTLDLTDVTMDVTGYGIWTFGKSADITISGTLDVTAVDSGILLYAKQMDGGNDFMGGLTLDMAYEIPENITNITFDGGTLIGTGDIVYAQEDEDSGNYAEINVQLLNGSSYSGAVQADTMVIDADSVWTVTGESVIGQLECEGTILGTAVQQDDGSWLVSPVEG